MRSLLCVSAVLMLMLALGAVSFVVADDVLEKARQAQKKVDDLQTVHMEKLQELESKTAASKVPLYNERGDVVRNIKGFWKEVIINHPSHINWLHAHDKEILEYLNDFRVEDIGEYQAGFLRHYKISMTFTRENPYFEDTVIFREIKGIAQGPDTKVSGIKWIGGKKPSGPSFFNFFENDSGAQGTETLHDHIYNDIAHVMRYEFWTNPFSYYDLPSNEKFAAEHMQHIQNYQDNLDAANEGGLPPADDVAAAIQDEVAKGNTPVNVPGTPVSEKTPTREEILALREKEEAELKKKLEKKAEKESEGAGEKTKEEKKEKAETPKEDKKKPTKGSKKSESKGSKKSSSQSKSGSKSASKSKEEVKPDTTDDGF